MGLSCTTLKRHQLEVEGLGADNLVLGRGAFGTVVLGKWYGTKVHTKSRIVNSFYENCSHKFDLPF